MLLLLVETQGGTHLGDGTAPVTTAVLYAGEAACIHAVDVQGAVEVVDLVLEDASMPTVCHVGDRAAALVQRLETHRPRPWHEGGEAIEAQAALEVLDGRGILDGESGVDEDLERDRGALAGGQLFRGQVLLVLRGVLDHSDA